ncbi:hypothetical protein Lgra_2260 [Legionella gratiana]|uniref:Uncharacterized protein n=1 Tax=Legionella gratiana TaxID=45066 RepID=A0A378JD88_9GAMM|nr:hypothetical protein [Legionella gratiana]KTD09025.1 hypothetical protein Lgra_2260 [Legionella gratiana]STX45762.1 Uncharacterised protein [Legionella gratiana]
MTERTESNENNNNLLMKMIESLFNLFGIKLGKGGGMPLNEAIKQPGAEQHAVGMLEDKTTQWLCQQALKIPGVSDMAQDYLNNNPAVKAFAQKVLDNPRLTDFKQDLKESGFLDKMDLDAKKSSMPQGDKQAEDVSLAMTAVKDTRNIQGTHDLVSNIDLPVSDETCTEQNTIPKEENTSQVRAN